MSEAINPNVPVGAESGTKAGVGDAVTFQDLDSSMEARSTNELRPKDDPQNTAPKAEKKEPRVTKEKAKEPKDGEKAAKDGGAKEDKEASDKEVDPSLGPQDDKAEVKFAKAKHGNDDVQIPTDTVFKQKVDGKLEDVSLQELLNDYSGRTNWDRKNSQLDVKARDFDTKVNTLQSNINEMFELSQSDPMVLIDHLCKIAGFETETFNRQFINGLANFTEEYAKMSDVEKENYHLKRKNDHSERQLRKRDESAAKERTQKEAQAKEAEVSAKFKMTEDDVKRARSGLESFTKEKGHTIEDVVSFHRASLAIDALTEVDEELASDEAVVDRLSKIAMDESDFGLQDLVDIAQHLWGNKPKEAKTLSRKLQKSEAEPKVQAKPQTQHKTTPRLSWDEA